MGTVIAADAAVWYCKARSSSGSGIIKGPGLRIEMDVRRCWRCPACGREARVPAWETAVRCECRSPGVWMKLIEPTPRPAPYVAPPLYEDEDSPDTEQSSAESTESPGEELLEQSEPVVEAEGSGADQEGSSAGA
jgi:hypothetical protein